MISLSIKNLLKSSLNKPLLDIIFRNGYHQMNCVITFNTNFNLKTAEKLNKMFYSTNPNLNKWVGPTELKPQMTEKEIYDIISQMSEDQRNSFSKAIDSWESTQLKSQLEGQLAATRWRSQFGRPAKVSPQLGAVDPTGSYCAVPEEWLHKKFVETAKQPPTPDLVKLMISNALPFIGFGFLDNFTMIIAGDYIEHTLGLYMCISTMAAAALGNTISDVFGIGSAYYIERIAESVGVRPPKLTTIQLGMKSSRRYANFGRVLGITLGCLLGMCPLMFMKEGEKKSKDKEKEKHVALDAEKSKN